MNDALRDTIGVCEICGKEYDRPHYNQKFCSMECREEGRRARQRKYWKRQGSDTRRERVEGLETEEDFDPAFLSEHPALNLLSAIAYEAHLDGDVEARDDLLGMIRSLQNG